MRKVCVVTGTRAEYGLLLPVMEKIKSSKLLELQLIASTMHMSNEFGLTYKQIEEDGFRIDDKIENLLSADSASSMVKSSGLAMLLLSESFKRLKPDVVLLLGDRYETHAAATTALLMNIPIAHIHGGEISEGAVDEQIRHSITKMSYFHFTSTEAYRKRVIQMGESPERVINSGAPGIDNILNMRLLSKGELEKVLNWRFGEKSALFTYHPVTLDGRDASLEIDMILESVSSKKMNILFTYANSDHGGRIINEKIAALCEKFPSRYKAVKSLGQLRYLSAMKSVDCLIGNTSSGIIEAASFNKPVVNIGDRQKGRLRSGNVTDCTVESLSETIDLVFTEPMKVDCKNIYGDGYASARIVETLESLPLSIVKKFEDC